MKNSLIPLPIKAKIPTISPPFNNALNMPPETRSPRKDEPPVLEASTLVGVLVEPGF